MKTLFDQVRLFFKVKCSTYEYICLINLIQVASSSSDTIIQKVLLIKLWGIHTFWWTTVFSWSYTSKWKMLDLLVLLNMFHQQQNALCIVRAVFCAIPEKTLECLRMNLTFIVEYAANFDAPSCVQMKVSRGTQKFYKCSSIAWGNRWFSFLGTLYVYPLLPLGRCQQNVLL